jgi:hypothetical protein
VGLKENLITYFEDIVKEDLGISGRCFCQFGGAT